MIEDQRNWTENLISRVGGGGKYQYLLFLNFSFKWILAGMILFSLNFFYIAPEFQCSKQELPNRQTCQDYVCSHSDPTFWLKHLEKPIPKSISLDYETVLLCSNAWISSLLQSLSYLGSFVGYLTMSHVADNFGRRKSEMISWGINLGGVLIMLFSVNLEMVGVGGFLMGMGTNATITLHYTFLKEMLTGRMRERSIIFLQVMFSIGVAAIALLSMLILNWKITLALFILIPTLILIPFSLWIIEETPSFSLKAGRPQLLRSLNRIAKLNGTEPLMFEDLDFLADLQQEDNNNNARKYSLYDLFRFKSLRNITVFCALIDLVIEFVYDGTILSLDKIGVNVYWDQILVGLVEIFAAIYCSWVIVKVKRKKFTKNCFALAALFILIIGILSFMFEHKNNEINFHTIVEMVILAALRFVLNSVWGVFFVYIAELFPASITSLSFGWISAVGTVGAFSAPYIRLLTADATMFIMSLLCLGSIFLVQQLRETKDQKIEQQIQEIYEEEQKRQEENKKSHISSEAST